MTGSQKGWLTKKLILLDRVQQTGALLFYPHDPVYPVSGLAVQENKMIPAGLVNNFKRAV